MTPPSGPRSALLFVFLTVLIDTIGLGIVIPVLPALIVELTGLGLARAATFGGALAFVYAAMQLVFAPVLGNLSDRFGRRPVLLFSLLAFGVDYLLMAAAPTIAWLFAGRAIAGMAGASYTAAAAYVADVTTPERRAQGFGLIGAAFGIGFIVGPAAGGLLGGYGTRLPFVVAAGAALANFVFGYFALPESLPHASRRRFDWRRANPLGTLLAIRRYPAVLGIAGAVFLWQLAHQSLPSVWSFYTLFEFEWSERDVGASLAYVGAVMVVSQGWLTRALIPRLGGERRSALCGLAGAIVGYLTFALAAAGWMLYAGLTLWLLAGLVYPSMNSLMSQRMPKGAQGELQGAVASLMSLSAIAGPPLMTQLFARFSAAPAPWRFPGAPYALSALLALAAAALFAAATRGAKGSGEVP
jgi:MFS transporter, DHA1 family, tetracycline resistance protein